jgi:hypothetical protein
MNARWGTHPLRSELGLRARAADAALSVAGQRLRLLAAICFAMFTSAAHGHAASTAYLDIGAPMAGTVDVQWAVALRDLDAVLDLDADSDDTLTWSEVVARRAAIERTTRDAVRLTSGNMACTLEIAPLRFAQLDSGGYAVVNAKVLCPTTADDLQLDYRFLRQIDATHRVLLSTPTSATPRPVAPNERVDVALTILGASATDRTTRAVDFRALLANGVTHILTGIDHLLFLVALLLPAVMRRTGERWVARARLKPALVEVVWIATAFTAAHSLTLGLASFHVIAIPARVIEPLIAATVLAAALNNLKPIVTRRVAAVAFCFGLIHGFGFAEVLAPLNLPARELAVALFGFNLGVEIGQLATIGCAFALLALARHWVGYGRWVLGAGSATLALTASVWMVERIFDVPLFALALAR